MDEADDLESVLTSANALVKRTQKRNRKDEKERKKHLRNSCAAIAPSWFLAPKVLQGRNRGVAQLRWHGRHGGAGRTMPGAGLNPCGANASLLSYMTLSRRQSACACRRISSPTRLRGWQRQGGRCCASCLTYTTFLLPWCDLPRLPADHSCKILRGMDNPLAFLELSDGTRWQLSSRI